MGGGSSVPAPVLRPLPTIDEAAIRKEEKKSREDQLRSMRQQSLDMKKRTGVASQSRNTGFSGSGIYIPGGGE